MKDDKFLKWFEENYASQRFPNKGGSVEYKDLPANMKALTFSIALAEFKGMENAA